MIDTVADFSQIQLKEFVRHASIRVKPVLRITPEALDLADVVTPFGTPLFLAHDKVFSLHVQTGVSMPIVGVIEAAWRWVGADPRDHFIGSEACDRKGLDQTVTLDDAHDHNLARSAPTTLTLSQATKPGLIAHNRAGERFPHLLIIGSTRTKDAIEGFPGSRARGLVETLPVNGYAQGEHFDQSVLDQCPPLTRFPRHMDAKVYTAAAAFAPSVGQFVARTMITFRTLLHRQTSLHLIRFG